ncbi:Lipid droplet-associated hydrolase [Blattella germanica]|nr:Lipid droplet-associated hydrolase [Blattella germanica]
MANKRIEGFVTVNGVPTNVVTWGGWLEDEAIKSQKEVVLFFPGQPGILGFYETFLAKLHCQLGLPVWAVSYAGQAMPPSESDLPPLAGNEHLYDLQGQIDHKIDFIQKFVRENMKITLVAHSMGSKMTIESLKDSSVRRKVRKAYLLFPALERLMEAPNANAFWVKHPKIYMLVGMAIVRLFYFFPLLLKKCIISFFLILNGIPIVHIDSVLQYMNPTICSNIGYLAYDKMNKVRELDYDGIKGIVDILYLYYGVNDGWIPLSYMNDLKEKYPDVDAVVCDKGIGHAFCLREGEKMADVLSDIYKQHKTKEVLN